MAGHALLYMCKTFGAWYPPKAGELYEAWLDKMPMYPVDHKKGSIMLGDCEGYDLSEELTRLKRMHTKAKKMKSHAEYFSRIRVNAMSFGIACYAASKKGETGERCAMLPDVLATVEAMAAQKECKSYRELELRLPNVNKLELRQNDYAYHYQMLARLFSLGYIEGRYMLAVDVVKTFLLREGTETKQIETIARNLQQAQPDSATSGAYYNSDTHELLTQPETAELTERLLEMKTTSNEEKSTQDGGSTGGDIAPGEGTRVKGKNKSKTAKHNPKETQSALNEISITDNKCYTKLFPTAKKQRIILCSELDELLLFLKRNVHTEQLSDAALLWTAALQRLKTAFLFDRCPYLTQALSTSLTTSTKEGGGERLTKESQIDSASSGFTQAQILERRMMVSEAIQTTSQTMLKGSKGGKSDLTPTDPVVEATRKCYICEVTKNLTEYQIRRRPKQQGTFRLKMCESCRKSRLEESRKKRKREAAPVGDGGKKKRGKK